MTRSDPQPANAVWRLARQQWFLIGLLGALVIGVNGSTQLAWLAGHRSIQNTLVFVVMFLMAWPLETRWILKTLRHPWPALLATAFSFVAVPVLAVAGSRWLDVESGMGLLVVAATPCTLASAAVWTARAGGDDAVALMTTIVTNALCFAVTPLIVWITIGLTAEISASDMSIRLLVLVLLPILLGQVLRRNRRLARAATARKRQFNVLAQLGILAMVLIGTVSTWQKIPDAQSVRIDSVAMIAIVCVAVHLVALAGGFFTARLLGMDRQQQIAVAFSGSQKTLMVGLLVCLLLNVTLFPMVIYHATQLITDTLIADQWARQGPAPARQSIE